VPVWPFAKIETVPSFRPFQPGSKEAPGPAPPNLAADQACPIAAGHPHIRPRNGHPDWIFQFTRRGPPSSSWLSSSRGHRPAEQGLW